MGWFDDLVEWGGDTIKDTGNWIGETASDVGSAVSYAANNVGDALEMAGQSVVSGVSSAAGYIVDTALQVPDAALNVVWDYTLRPTVNLFLDEEDDIGQTNLIDFGIVEEAFYDGTRWVEEPEEFLYEINDDGSFKLDDKGEMIAQLDEDGNAIRNPRHIILHGVQNTVGRVARIVTDVSSGVLGLAADAFVALTWDISGRHALNVVRYGWSAVRGTEYGGNFGNVGFGTCANGLTNATRFAWEDPDRAGDLAMQGLSDASSATIGLFGDVGAQLIDGGKNVVWDWTTRPVVNLFRDDDNQFEQTSLWDWGVCAEGLKESWQFIEPPSEFLYERNEDGSYRTWTNSSGEEERVYAKGADGKRLRNPNFHAELTILYTTQGIGEIGAFVAVSMATAGVGGAIIGGLRGGATATRGGVALSRTARIAQGFNKGAGGAFKIMSPITSKSIRAAEYGEKAAKLGKIGEKLYDGTKLGRFEKLRGLTLTRKAGRVGAAAEKSGKALSKARRFARAAFNKQAKAATKADDLATVAKTNIGNGKKLLGKEFSGMTTSPGRAIPELIGVEMTTGMGFVGEISRGKAAWNRATQIETLRLDTSLKNDILLFRDEGGIDANDPDFIETLKDYGLKPGTVEYDAAVDLLENGPQPETEQAPGGTQSAPKDTPKAPPSTGKKETGYIPSNLSLTEQANLAYSHNINTTQILQDYTAGFTQYRSNPGLAPAA